MKSFEYQEIFTIWDIPWRGQGYDHALDIPGISFEVFGISQGCPDIEKSEMGYPKLMKDIPN
jgi:hypothetical protein